MQWNHTNFKLPILRHLKSELLWIEPTYSVLVTYYKENIQFKWWRNHSNIFSDKTGNGSEKKKKKTFKASFKRR